MYTGGRVTGLVRKGVYEWGGRGGQTTYDFFSTPKLDFIIESNKSALNIYYYKKRIRSNKFSDY